MLLFVTCTSNKGDIHVTSSANNTGDFGRDVEISYYSKGILEFELFAPEIETTMKQSKLFSKGITVYAYNPDLDTLATISANFATENQEKDIFEVRKNVVLTNAQNEQLNTEKLFWDRSIKKIYTDEFVTLTTDKQIIMGFGFTSDQYFSTYSLSNITATIYL